MYTIYGTYTKKHSNSVINAHRSLSNDVERDDERSDAKTKQTERYDHQPQHMTTTRSTTWNESAVI